MGVTLPTQVFSYVVDKVLGGKLWPREWGDVCQAYAKIRESTIDERRETDDTIIKGDRSLITPTGGVYKSISHLSKVLSIYMKNSKK